MRQMTPSKSVMGDPPCSQHDMARLSMKHAGTGPRLDHYASVSGAGLSARTCSVEVSPRLAEVDVAVVTQQVNHETLKELAKIVADTMVFEGNQEIDSKVPPELLQCVYDYNYELINCNSASSLSRLVVARYNLQPVALATATFDGDRHKFLAPKDSWLVEDVAVRRDLQGIGIGTKVMHALLAELRRFRVMGKSKGPGLVHLICRPPLEGFYAKFGFAKDLAGLNENQRQAYTLTLTDGTDYQLTRVRMTKKV